MNGGSWVAGGATEGPMSPHPTSPSHFGAPSGSGASARARSAMLAIASAVLTEFAFDLGFSIARGTELNLGYVSLCGLLMLGAGLACAGVGALLPGTGLRAALTLYVVLHGFADPMSPWYRTVRRPRAWEAHAGSFSRRIAYAAGSRGAGNDRRSRAVRRPRTLDLHAGGARNPPGVSRARSRSARRSRSCSPWGPPGSGSRFAAAFLRCLHAPVSSVVALGLALAGTAFAFRQARPQATSLRRHPGPTSVVSLPDVFVLVLDTVRADHLSSYGYERDTTPNLRRFLAEHREAVQYDLAFSPASWTVPAHASLLTGTMPSVHHARSSGKRESFLGSATKSLALVADETLAEVLRQRRLLHGRGRGQRLSAARRRAAAGLRDVHPTRCHPPLPAPRGGAALEILSRRLRRPDQTLSIGGGDQHRCASHAPGVRPRALVRARELHGGALALPGARSPHGPLRRRPTRAHCALAMPFSPTLTSWSLSSAIATTRVSTSSMPSSSACSRSWRPRESCSAPGSSSPPTMERPFTSTARPLTARASTTSRSGFP